MRKILFSTFNRCRTPFRIHLFSNFAYYIGKTWVNMLTSPQITIHHWFSRLPPINLIFRCEYFAWPTGRAGEEVRADKRTHAHRMAVFCMMLTADGSAGGLESRELESQHHSIPTPALCEPKSEMRQTLRPWPVKYAGIQARVSHARVRIRMWSRYYVIIIPFWPQNYVYGRMVEAVKPSTQNSVHSIPDH